MYVMIKVALHHVISQDTYDMTNSF